MRSPTPEHPVLAAIAGHLERFGMAAAICDRDMRMIWFASEYWRIFGDVVEGWHGLHYMEFSLSKEFREKSTDRSILRGGIDLVPMLIDHTPGGKEAVRSMLASILGEEAGRIVDHLPDRQDPVWSMSVKFSPVEGLPAVNTSGLFAEVRDRNGEFIGVAATFFAPLPFRFVSLLARGDEESLERMVRLAKPGRRSAAVLFADLQSSGLLSRRLPSAVYFALVRALISAIDDVVASHKGIVGRHAGDGATAFFLTDDLGSASLASRASISAARDIRDAARSAVAEAETETQGLVTAADCPINVGLHWGGSLYMGQLVTGGRLEVTALGDAVNECARIQETARDGEILASKALLENLDVDAASALDLDPDGLSYMAISERPNASEKAVRDAGGIAVALL